MDNIQLQQFKRTIEGLLEESDEPLGHREDIAVESTPDTLDQVQNAAARALAIRQLELNYSRQRGLREALERIEDGSYGVCLKCDEDISLKRLKVVPWAAFCLRCQESADREESEAADRESFAGSLVGGR
jgi:DnaK suppressor protein